ncbi:ATP-binding protein [Streptomyces sp. CHA1]|uniref:SCO6881 family protein n=1 Tax=unclassified Streptomyces TaxID=2593676 RepID=UPI001BFC2762|nr:MULTISPECIES: ATP-binding protein [unclassified Streptomyces]MBT3160128.1 ATP-binding protein [Streptomyces sp. G11C]MCO6704320.1 ATP-binding protein [Streptomyces sp. CHB9.2]MCO6710590.1 ATP-binding protein [Streptomyces sp. CHA3]MCO6716390.1 ATP-binding protein [Streptomyces sp. CHB19.2]MCO6722521.1 ATP-binding protein [Streptomyces sp. Vc714c-19]
MGVCDFPLMDKVCGAVDFATNPAGTVTDGIGAWIAKSAGELAASAADLAARAVNKTTAIDLGAGWFRDNYELLLPIGLALTVGIFCIQLMFAAWRRDERALAQAALGTAAGVLFSFSAIAFTTVAITVVDALSDGLFQAANTSIDDAIRRVVKVDQLGAMYGLGWGVSALVAFGCAIGAFLYWGVMVARKVGVLIMVALAVFAGAGGGWEVAKRWRRGWIEATATLVVSKLLMTVVFLIGVSAMGKADASDGMAALSDAMAGIVVMVLVLLCPYAVYKFVHWAGDSGGHDGLHRSGVAGLAVAAGAAKTAGTLAVQARTGAPAPQGPNQVPGAGADGVASGINPAGGNLSKEGINAGPPKPQTRFRYGEDPNATGDKGRALIQRPGTPALITRPSGGGQGATDSSTGASAPGGSMTSMPPAGPAPSDTGPPSTGPSAAGSPTPTDWVPPTRPPSDS